MSTDVERLQLVPARYLMAFADHAPYLNVASSTGAWSAWTPVPSPGSTDVAFAAAAIGTRVYLFSKGINDRQLYWRHTV